VNEIRLRSTRRFAAVLALAGAAAGCRETPQGKPGERPYPATAARAETAGYSLTPAEKRAIDAFLERNRNLRVATDRDRRLAGEGDEGEVRGLYGLYHPYFVRGDLNDDGTLDFVLAFVRRDSDRETPWFTVVVFTGQEKTGGGLTFGSETFLEKDISLADGDLAIDRDAILITPDLAQETTRRYRWDPSRKSYIFVREGGEEAQPPPLAET